MNFLKWYSAVLMSWCLAYWVIGVISGNEEFDMAWGVITMLSPVVFYLWKIVLNDRKSKMERIINERIESFKRNLQ